MDEFSVCFTHPLMVDTMLFREWLVGTSEQDAAKKLATSTTNAVGDVPYTILIQEVREQFVLFAFLQQYLQSPQLLNSPILSSLEPSVKDELLESYYKFDKEVMREILGKKMSAKLRKDMDDVSEKTGITLKSCQRQVNVAFHRKRVLSKDVDVIIQFDNIKNIIRIYEDMEGGVVETLTKYFSFSQSLIKKYYPLVFAFISRFETSKKRLQYLTYDDIILCTDIILEKWTYTMDLHNSLDKSVEVDEIDRNFVQDLRDLKSFATEKDFQDAHKILVLNRLDKKTATAHFLKSIDGNFRAISRSIFVLGSGLSHTKDFRDFFNDCVERIIEPLKQFEWSLKEVDVFFTDFINAWGDFKEHPFETNVRNFDAIFIRFMEVMKKCLLTMYK